MKVFALVLSLSLIAICDVLGASTNRHSKKHHKEMRDAVLPPCTSRPDYCPPCECPSPSSPPSTDQQVISEPTARHHKKNTHKKSHNKKSHAVRDGTLYVWNLNGSFVLATPNDAIGLGPGPVCPPCNCSSTDNPTPVPEVPPSDSEAPVQTPPAKEGPQTRHNRHGNHAMEHTAKHATKKHHAQKNHHVQREHHN